MIILKKVDKIFKQDMEMALWGCTICNKEFEHMMEAVGCCWQKKKEIELKELEEYWKYFEKGCPLIKRDSIKEGKIIQKDKDYIKSGCPYCNQINWLMPGWKTVKCKNCGNRYSVKR